MSRPWQVGVPWLVATCLVSFTPALLSCRSKKTSLVVGVQSEPMGGAVASVHVLVKVGGAIVRDETLRAGERSPLTFPRAWETAPIAGDDESAPVEVEVSAFDAARPDTPLIRRGARAHLSPGRKALLRLVLESRCIVYPAPPRAPGSPPGPLNGPECEAPSTCIRGSCRSADVRPEQLEAYRASWADDALEPCKAKGAGPPSLEVGTGQVAYSPVSPGQELVAEAGPQGGHHVWVALRMHNLGALGTTTTIAGVQPGTGRAIPPSTFRFPLDPADAGACELYGLRYQLDNEGVDYAPFLGEPLDLHATVVDASGATARATLRVRVAAELAAARPPAQAPHARDR